MEIVQHGGITLVILFLCSLFLITVVLERYWFFKNEKINSKTFLAHLSSTLSKGELSSAIDICKENEGFITRVALEGLKRYNSNSITKAADAMKVSILEENSKMERFVPTIGTIAVIAPFIGLFGTVLGIIRAFEDIALHKSTGPEVVSKGVAEALIATAAGLLVAIVAVVFFNYFKYRIKQVNIELSVTASKILELLEEHLPAISAKKES